MEEVVLLLPRPLPQRVAVVVVGQDGATDLVDQADGVQEDGVDTGAVSEVDTVRTAEDPGLAQESRFGVDGN